MKRMLIIVSIIIGLIAGGVAYLSLSSSEVATTGSNKTVVAPPAETAPSPQSAPQAKGAYVGYSADVVASTPGTKLLFFHAPWCPQCRAIDEDITKNGAPDGVTIIKVDFDSSQELRKKYGVTLQTTVVRIDDTGELVKKYVAYDSPTLESVKTNLL